MDKHVMTNDTEPRVQRLEDIESIRLLKSLFATHFDDAVNDGGGFDRVLEQFAPDAVWESEHFGTHSGAGELEAFFEHYRDRVSFCLHYVLGDIIDIADDRETAHGQWISWEPMTLDGQAVICAARYFDDYQRIAGEWRFKLVRMQVGFLAPYGDAWAPDRVPPDWKW